MSRETRNGKTLTTRVWALIEDAQKETGIPLRVIQGSYNAGGVAQSAGTHDGGGAFDLSVLGMSEKTAIKVVVALRKRNCAAWLRSPKFGWPPRLSGSHIHVIVMDEPDLSSGARQQVTAYKAGRNGLASHAPDPFPRPHQAPFHPGGGHPGLVAVGARGETVKRLQRALHITPVDGIFGPQTGAAVRASQAHLHLPVDKPGHEHVSAAHAKALGL